MHLARGISTKVAIGLGVLAIAAASAVGADVLVSQHLYMDGVDGVTGLAGVRQVVVSPDGKNVYTAGEGDSAITVWSRAHDGSLKEIQVLQDKVGGITGINFVDNLSVSQDGRNVYAAGILSKSFVTFSRDSATGKLTEVQVLKNGVDVAAGLNGVVYNTISPDGKNVYSAALLDNAVVVFARNKRTGLLTPIQVFQDGVGGVTGLKGPFPVMVSSDGKNVYVGGRLAHTVLVYSRDRAGKLTLVQTLTEGVGGVIGIDGARSIIQSFDSKLVYVSGLVHSSVAVFSRNPATGTLSQNQAVIWHVNGVIFFHTPTTLVQSFDHQHLFVTAFDSFSLDSFKLDRRTGKIGAEELHVADPGDGSVNPGVIEVVSAAMSPGGQNLYTVSYFTGALNVWKIAEHSHEPSPGGPAPEAAEDGNPPE